MLRFFHQINDMARELETTLTDAPRYFLLTDENVARHCLPELLVACPFLKDVEVIEIEAGEASKSHEIIQHIWQHLLDCGADRGSVLLNLGGGVVTDIGGFVASTYKRGIKSIHIPTSLLGMVDAAIGGKTGIDFAGVKNAIGTFYSSNVFVYPSFIKSLPKHELVSGLGEMIKTGMIRDAGLAAALMGLNEVHAKELMPHIEVCARIKEEIVKMDPFESGERKLLNFGHTMGHACESAWMTEGHYKPHGLCVAIGILAEARIAEELKICDSKLVEKLDRWIIPTFELQNLMLPELEQMTPFLLQDKKNRAGTIRMVLPQKPGSAKIDVQVDRSVIEKAWSNLRMKITS